MMATSHIFIRFRLTPQYQELDFSRCSALPNHSGFPSSPCRLSEESAMTLRRIGSRLLTTPPYRKSSDRPQVNVALNTPRQAPPRPFSFPPHPSFSFRAGPRSSKGFCPRNL